MDKSENIKQLFTKIQDRKDFFKKISDEFNVEVSTVETNWFSKGKVPKKYGVEDRVIMFMQKYIQLQNGVIIG
ncbi:hypothetical protein [Tenacibaculum sp. 190524A02b]|uniref:hypothetical protein n=1 Tax=Tenacibaculum vairaonense TaxID=3137860 RepID=UPI0031FB3E44